MVNCVLSWLLHIKGGISKGAYQRGKSKGRSPVASRHCLIFCQRNFGGVHIMYDKAKTGNHLNRDHGHSLIPKCAPIYLGHTTRYLSLIIA